MNTKSNAEITAEKRNPILDDGKSTELREAESLLENDPTIDIPESEKRMIMEDAADAAEAEEIIEAEKQVVRRKKAMTMAKKKIDKDTPDKYLHKQPTSGQIEAVAYVHMKQAYNLMKGRGGAPDVPPITSLFGAAKKMNQLVADCRTGCPYAAKFLIEIEASIDKVIGKFEAKEEELHKQISERTLIKAEMFSSNKPTKIPLLFGTPYAYLLTDLLLRFDKMLRELYPYYTMRIIKRDEFEKTVLNLSRDIRRLCCQCDPYFYVGAESVKRKDDVYYQAVNSFGELDPAIISGELRPQLIARL